MKVWSGLIFVAIAILTAAAGCGSGNPETATVNGKVTYKGEPVTNGLVQFVPDGDGNSATGELQPDGSFHLTTFERDDGAVPGKYKVAVQVFPDEGDGGGLPGMEFAGKKPPIPPKYGDSSTSGLTADIKSGDNDLELKLE